MFRAAEKCGVETAVVQPFIDALKANFLNDLEDFEELTDEEWKEYGVTQKPLIRQIKKVIAEMKEQANEEEKEETAPKPKGGFSISNVIKGDAKGLVNIAGGNIEQKSVSMDDMMKMM